MQTYKTLLIQEEHGILTITFNRLAERNSINADLLTELQSVLTAAATNPAIKLLVLAGQAGIFCTGMDFRQFQDVNVKLDDRFSAEYMQTLKQISLLPKIVISQIDGQVIAGGVGFVASSDYVIATPRSQFHLSEALWGLLPACVLPFLIRRVGFQIAYRMTLTTNLVSAEQAANYHLVDELTEQPEKLLQKLYLRLARLESSTVSNLKQYFRKLWIIDEPMEQLAVREITRLTQEPQTQINIRNFLNHGTFPWEKE